ncbi:MAG TPA: M20/M25/M40 family metallo-hydrolase [Ktedonobacteraceae bacterium]|jgi:arginine utilization protein RocB|nr:M20/M25/M40 family metallo-hydrolase [Ktedonobacteraceae bacterium]
MIDRVEDNAWYSTVKRYTTRLVNIRSVSPGEGEIGLAEEILRLLQENGLEDAYTAIGLDRLAHDPFGRQNVYAFLRGNTARTLVLLGHFDTVDTRDYGVLEPYALDPEALDERQTELAAMVPGLAEDLQAHPGDWMFGRGCADMKSGVAVNIALMRHFVEQARSGKLNLSILMLATPDEENESAGVIHGVRFLLDMRKRYGLEYLGAINTDYVTALYPDDPHRYIFTGTIGKMLPSFYVVGRPSHVGDPFDGVDANLLAAELIRDISMNDELCDEVRGQLTPPPVTLKFSDLKTSYDVQLPFAAYFYVNILTFSTSPGELLERLRNIAETSLRRFLHRLDETEQRWLQRKGETRRVTGKKREGVVLTYQQLYEELCQQRGEQTVQDELRRAWDSMPTGLDSRSRCLHLVRHLWTLSERTGPAVVLYFSPPFIPHVAETRCQLHEVARKVAERHPEHHLRVQEYFPFICDMSYLRLDPGIETSAWVRNMPVWDDTTYRPGSYSLPFAAMEQLGLPAIDLGPYGKGAHQAGERVLLSYSFGVLPQLICEVIEGLAREQSA